MVRRKSVKCSTQQATLPSWSWVGWSGDALNSDSWRSAGNYQYDSQNEHLWHACSWKTYSTVSWYYSIELVSKRKLIKTSTFQMKDGDGASELPPGWSKSEKGQYFHRSCPDQPFNYPTIIRDPYIAHTSPIRARYLHGTTSRSFLQVAGNFDSFPDLYIFVDLLVPGLETWAGTLRLMSENTEEAESIRGQHMEIIEISMGTVQSTPFELQSFDEYGRGLWPKSNGVYEFYNVLWIEWDGSIAYRKACGKVAKSIWDNLKKDRIEITLG